MSRDDLVMRIGVVLFALVLLLIVGCFMEVVAALILLTPVLAPALFVAGLDPVFVGVMMVYTLGIGLVVVQIVYAFDLARHGQRTGTPGSNPQLGGWVLGLNAVAFVWSVATAGIGFLLGGVALGVLATWLVQAEINRYAEGNPA